MGIKTIQKVITSGSSLGINIPKKIIEILKIERGDYINIDWGEIIKQNKKEVIKEELPEI